MPGPQQERVLCIPFLIWHDVKWRQCRERLDLLVRQVHPALVKCLSDLTHLVCFSGRIQLPFAKPSHFISVDFDRVLYVWGEISGV